MDVRAHLRDGNRLRASQQRRPDLIEPSEVVIHKVLRKVARRLRSRVALGAAIAIPLAGCSPLDRGISSGDSRFNPSLRSELLERVAVDQELRNVDVSTMDPQERRGFFEEVERVEQANTARLMEIVEAHGWPTSTLVGPEGVEAAFLLLQHADDEPDFQARCLPRVTTAVERGEASAKGLAYLTDRVRVHQRRPQVYGTQYYVVKNEQGQAITDQQGRIQYLSPIVESPEDIDARRLRMGLDTWAEQEARAAADHERPPFDAPRGWNGMLPVEP